MISKEVEHTLTAAAREAHLRHHEYLSLEHLLFALVQSEKGAQALRACGGDPAVLKAELEIFFQRHMERSPGDEPH
ncbi:hypothetical protein G3N55_05215, partial [Dissulfurirhabdus thermomarina]